MAHKEQREFLLQCKSRFPNYFKSNKVIEIGSQNINGTVRDLFDSEYLGIDIGPGKDVDFICHGEVLQLPNSYSDVTLSTECFEHALKWQGLLLNMIRITKPSGLIMLTFAGRGRPAHGTIDSEFGCSPYTTDHYKNITPLDFFNAISIDYFFNNWAIEANNSSCDTYFWGIRSHNEYKETNEIKELEYMLSKARGQLSQAVRIITEKDRAIADKVNELDRHRNELEQNKNSIGYFLKKLLKKLRGNLPRAN